MNTDRKLIMFGGSHKSKSYFSPQNFNQTIELIKQKQTMYDINVFLENRGEIINQLERLEFNLYCVGDHAHESFEFEIDMGNVSLVVNATIMETFIDYTRETRDEPADYVFERDFNEINEAYYITSEGDEIPCTPKEIEVNINVIKSLL